jgi:hypothetical protein
MSWYANIYDKLFGPVYNQYLTGISDVDYQIMMQLNIHQLRNLCLTNMYTNSLCHGKNFWLKK